MTETKTYRKIHFAVMAIESSAKKAKISGKAMHDRLKAQGLIHKRLLDFSRLFIGKIKKLIHTEDVRGAIILIALFLDILNRGDHIVLGWIQQFIFIFKI